MRGLVALQEQEETSELPLCHAMITVAMKTHLELPDYVTW